MMKWLAFFLSLQASAATLSAVKPNNEGVANLMKEDNYHAYQKLIEAAAEDSFDPTIRMNLGLVYSVNKEDEKALAEFKMAEALAGDNNEMKFKARFNQGVVLAAAGKIDEALKAYQSALEIKPDSPEVKTNIELIWQSQQGKGKGKGDQNKDKSNKGQGDGSGDQNQDKKDQNQGQNDQQQDEKKNNQPKPFDSKDLSQETVKKILDELKSQEQRVRAEEYSKGAKERPRDKNW